MAHINSNFGNNERESIVLQVRVDAQGKTIVQNMQKNLSYNVNSYNNNSPTRMTQSAPDSPTIRKQISDFQEDESDTENIGGPFDKNNIEAPHGVTKTVRRRIEVPKEFLERTLQEGETVIGEYDYYYTNKRMYLSDVILYGIYTGGIFFLLYGAYKLYRFLRNIICCFCWKPFIDNKRGKMVITSNGRVIFWESSLYQSKAADSRAYFDVSFSTHAASIHDLKQMKISFEHKKQGCYYFCARFEACVELTFFSFNHKDSNRSKFLRTQNSNSYIAAIKSFIMGKVKGSKRQQSEPLTVGITSDISDKAGTPYGFENSEQHLEEMMKMCENLMSQLTFMRDSFMKSSAYLPITKHNLHLAQMNNEEIDAYRSVGAAGVNDIYNEINGTSPLVDKQDENRVNVPIKWLLLAPGEELVAAVGQRYYLNWGEVLLSILSFGLFYFVRLRIKQWQRSAIFITNKRLIEMTVNQHRGRIPVAFTGFRAVARSYFLGENVTSGFIKGTRHQIISSLMTSAGQITAVLPRDQLAFAHRMQLTASRADGLRSYESVNAYLPEKFQYSTPDELEGRGRGMLTDVDLALLPTLFEEDIISRFPGGIKYVPCCAANPYTYLERCFNARWVDTKPQSHLCIYDGNPCKSANLMFSKILTCFFYPLSNRSDGIVTTHSMYYISAGKKIQDPFFITWVPVKSLIGYSTSVKTNGAAPYQNCCICCNRKAVVRRGMSRYEMNVRTSEGFTLPFSYNLPFHNWLEDDSYTKMAAVMGAIDIRHDVMMATYRPISTDNNNNNFSHHNIIMNNSSISNNGNIIHSNERGGNDGYDVNNSYNGNNNIGVSQVYDDGFDRYNPNATTNATFNTPYAANNNGSRIQQQSSYSSPTHTNNANNNAATAGMYCNDNISEPVSEPDDDDFGDDDNDMP